jgi:hypothetical protein
MDWWINGLVDWWIGGLVDWWIGGLMDGGASFVPLTRSSSTTSSLSVHGRKFGDVFSSVPDGAYVSWLLAPNDESVGYFLSPCRAGNTATNFCLGVLIGNFPI